MGKHPALVQEFIQAGNKILELAVSSEVEGMKELVFGPINNTPTSGKKRGAAELLFARRC